MLGDDLAWALGELRVQAETTMSDSCVITRHDEVAKVWDPVLLRYSHPTSTIYDGPCRVRILAVQPKAPAAGEAEYAKVGYRVSVPLSVIDVRHGDRVTVTASAKDAALVGRSYIVTAAPAATDLTARRLTVSEVT